MAVMEAGQGQQEHDQDDEFVARHGRLQRRRRPLIPGRASIDGAPTVHQGDVGDVGHARRHARTHTHTHRAETSTERRARHRRRRTPRRDWGRVGGGGDAPSIPTPADVIQMRPSATARYRRRDAVFGPLKRKKKPRVAFDCFAPASSVRPAKMWPTESESKPKKKKRKKEEPVRKRSVCK